MARPDIEAVIGANEAGFIAAMNRVRSSSRQTSQGLKADFSTIASGFARLNGLLAGLGVAFSLQSVVDTVKSIGDIADVADRVGVTTAALQEMRHAAEMNGSSFDAMDKALRVFAVNVAEAANGQVSTFSKVLEANNVSLRNAEGQLRSTQDILYDYANLVAGASSEHDRLLLAQTAMGPVGAELIGILSQGADGFRENAQAARELGVVLEEDVIRAAQEMADSFDAYMASASAAMKGFVVTVLDGAAKTIQALQHMSAMMDQAARGRQTAEAIGALAGKSPDDIAAISGSARQKRIRDAILQSMAEGRTNQSLPSLRDSMLSTQVQETVIPSLAPAKSGGGAKAKREERDAAAELIAKLEEELTLVGQSDTAKRVSNALRQAGADATQDQKDKIAELIGKIDEEAAAHKRAEEAIKAKTEAAEFFAQASLDAFSSIISGSEDAEDAIRKLGIQILNATAQALLLGSGPLAGLFGTSGGGGALTSLLGSLFGARAAGGPVTAGKIYRVGEQGPEYFRPNTGGSIIPNGADGDGGGGVVRVVIAPSEMFQVQVAETAGQVVAEYDKGRVSRLQSDQRELARRNRG